MQPVVVLVKPPEQSRFNFGAFSLGVLAAAVREMADVQILDATDLTVAEAAREICSLKPDWVGITTMALSSLMPASELIKSLKPSLPKSRIIVGGHGASMQPEPILQAGADAVVRGEGEWVLKRLLEWGIEANTPGLVQYRDGKFRSGPDQPLISPLDDLPSPARDLMPPPKNQVHLMETSRGCPHDCRFCETTRFYGRRWRYQTPHRVVAEVQRLIEEREAWIIEITDDNFAASRRRVMQICEGLMSRELPAFFLLSARADDLLALPELLPAMARARMLRISVGVETLSPELARSAGKYISLENYRKLFERMRELGMFSVASFIIGLPGETDEQREHALELALAAGPDSAQFVPFYPYPGIPLAEGYLSAAPSTASMRRAEDLTHDFYRNAHVHSRLEKAAQQENIRAYLARGTLEKYGITIPKHSAVHS